MHKLVYFSGLILLFSVVNFSASATTTANNYEALYVFGDSLSDTGRTFTATGGIFPPSPPYSEGRYADERVWIEYLAERLGLPYVAEHNYAWGGAKTGETYQRLFLTIPSVLAQLDDYLANNTVNPNGLYFIFAGSNDLIDLQSVEANLINAAAENVITALIRLHEQGAQHLMITTNPNISRLPGVENPAVLETAVQDFNAQLVTRIAELPFKVAYVDGFQITESVVNAPETYGIVNVTDTCFDEQTGQVCENPSTYAFWDADHPTSRVHQLIADEVEAALQGHYFLATASMLKLPVVEFTGGNGDIVWYQADLQYLPELSPETFEVTGLVEIPRYTRIVEVATYADNAALVVPTVEVGGIRYAAELQLVPDSTPLRFELSRLTQVSPAEKQ